ncbi:carbohydrate ABC transporter permease [Kibdelosporangium philippinense]|uniref:Carbohydrate ABC transporter permease n=1 Tax=Kibdelosporangium philippinense TaxID=211113 RepID=A0ABS8ZWH0_9PSEU|nr:carbohydrate ABC transporter permease [Kibdelosporangium philippinense]MCE7011977.1 carbohydrate ABC transporter permease [Kibdelosporangium philippinense]
MRTLVSPTQLRSGRGKAIYWTIFTIVMLLFLLAFIFPLYWAITGAMKDPAELVRTPPTMVPDQWHPEVWGESWERLNLLTYFGNTVLVAVGAWLIQLAVDVPAAYALSKLRPVLGNKILALMLATLMVPASALLVPTYVTITDLPIFGVNLINSPTAIWFPAAANAFNIYLLKRFFDQIPGELLEAAVLDGASQIRILWRIVLPISKPILAVVSILAIVAAWKDFIWPLLVFPDPTKQTLSVALQRMEIDMPLNILLAGLLLASIPMVLLFLFFQRHILAGLTAGSVKG